jgi:hypothetical protein
MPDPLKHGKEENHVFCLRHRAAAAFFAIAER